MNSGPLLFLLLTSAGATQTRVHAVDCGRGQTITAAVSESRPGDTIRVRGTCRESVRIQTESSRLSLESEGARVQGADPTVAVFTVLGRGIRITGFHISGGRNGVNILRGGTAYLDSNTIEKNGGGSQPGSGDGVNVAQHSFASFTNNVIQDNPGCGIVVHENSSVRIGFTDVDNPTPGTNTIQRNGRAGVCVQRSASARIVGNVIRGHRRDGVAVSHASHAVVSANIFNGNADNAISVTQNSGVSLGGDTGILASPNRSDPAGARNGYGVTCRLGGYVDGTIGAISVVRAKKRFSGNCVDGTTP